MANLKKTILFLLLGACIATSGAMTACNQQSVSSSPVESSQESSSSEESSEETPDEPETPDDPDTINSEEEQE